MRVLFYLDEDLSHGCIAKATFPPSDMTHESHHVQNLPAMHSPT